MGCRSFQLLLSTACWPLLLPPSMCRRLVALLRATVLLLCRRRRRPAQRIQHGLQLRCKQGGLAAGLAGDALCSTRQLGLSLLPLPGGAQAAGSAQAVQGGRHSYYAVASGCAGAVLVPQRLLRRLSG